MAEKHPDELALLSYVEEDLPGEDRRAVAEHLVACRSCSDDVRRLQAGRASLRAAPLLELPEERRAEILASLPERRDPWAFLRPARRVLVVAAPAAAAAALVAVFVLAATQLPGGGDDDAGDQAAVAEDAGGGDEAAEGALEMTTQTVEEDRAATETDAPSVLKDGQLVRSVRGPAAEVVRLLEAEGIDAEVEGGEVFARAGPAEVRAALAGRPGGDVGVYVR
jgi:hypothetical protein